MKTILAITAALALSGCMCTDQSGARRVLEAQGYTNIEIGGYRFMTCGDNDTYSTGFTATAPNGTRVTGAVCSPLIFGGNRVYLD